MTATAVATDHVPIEVAQQMVRDSGLNFREIARRKGWMRERNYVSRYRRADGEVVKYKWRVYVGEDARLKRWLGLMANIKGKTGKATYKRSLSYDDTVILCRLLGLDPVDYDL